MLSPNGSKSAYETIGPRFLELVCDYMEANDLEPVSKFDLPKRPDKAASPKKIAGSSHRESLLLFREGKSVEEIASIRKLAPGTIHSHLATFIESGELEIETLVKHEYIEEINRVIHQIPEFKSLTELKEKCGEYISYSDIRSVVSSHRFKAGTTANS